MEWIRPIAVFALGISLACGSLYAQEPTVPVLPAPTPVSPGNGGGLAKLFSPTDAVPGPIVFDNACGNGCGFYTGAALYLLRPYFANNAAYVTNTGFGTPFLGQTTTDFSWNFSASPALWVGWTSDCGLGVRGRAFYFDQYSQTANASLNFEQSLTTTISAPPGLASPAGATAFGAPGSILTLSGKGVDLLCLTSGLRLYTIDLEATWTGRSGNFAWVAAGGGRYLQLNQGYNGTLTNNVGPALGGPASETQTLLMNHNFSGFGPTLDFRGDYYLLNSGFSVFGDVRGSLLLGTAQQATSFTSNILDPNGIAGGSRLQGYNVSSTHETTLPMLEVELGVAYTFMLGRVKTTLSAGAVTQTYFDAGSASQTSGNLSLFGGRFSLGLQF